MKKLSLKAVSCALIVAMVLPLAACNKNKSKSREKSRSGTVIAADAPWFESSVIKSQPEVDTKKGLEYASQALAGTDEKYVGIYSNGYYKMPTNNNIDWETFDYSKYMIAYLSLMDKKTAETVKKIDLSEYLPKNGYVEQVNYSDGKFNVRITSFDSKSSQMTVNSLVIDAMSGKLVDKKEMPYDEESGRYFDHTFELGLYTFKTSMNWDENDRAYYSLYISKGEDSDVRAIELKDNEKNIYDVPIVLKLSDDKYLAAANSDMDTIYYEIDVNSYTATAVDSKKYEWLDARNIGNTFAGKQIDLISSDEEEDKEKEEEKIENKQKDIKQKTNHPSFPKYSKIPYTLSILLPSSIIDNAQSKELRTYLIGEIARIIGIFKISEIIILHDKLKENSKDYLNYFVKNLQYLETPQYLRKTLFPKSEDLLMSGLMNPLESQHHLRIDEWCPYREGCVINRPVKEGVNASWVNIGLKKDCKINQRLPEKTRLTIKLNEKGFDNKLKYYTGEPVSMSEPLEKLGLYWGYIVRVCENFNEVFSQSIYNENYDFIIGTSDKGENYKYANYNKKKDFKHALIIFGGIQGIEGMFDYDEHNKKNIDNIFDLYLNTCVNQGLRTIRTEEAILISLAVIRPELDKLKGI